MAFEQNTDTETSVATNAIAFALLPEGLVAIQVTGRGSFHNSVELKRLADAMFERVSEHKTRFIVDLAACSTMDSTFMGVLASIGLRQLKESAEQLIVLNANPHVVNLLDTLGLIHFINVRKHREDTNWQCTIMETEGVSRVDRIIHMIEAHQHLCDADPENNIRFESVLKYLNESLKEEKQ